MSEVVGLATQVVTIDDAGGQNVSISVITTMRAKVRYDNTQEKETGSDKDTLEQNIKVWIRYSSDYADSPELYQIVWGGIFWDIVGIEKTPGSRFMVIKARRYTT
jgi:head-tail adaptor